MTSKKDGNKKGSENEKGSWYKKNLTPKHLDGLIDIILVPLGHLANDILRGRVNHVELPSRNRIFPLIVDENLSEFDFRIRIGFHNFFFGENKIHRGAWKVQS